MPSYRRLFDLRLGGRARADAEMDLEIESHLEMRIADLVSAGRSPAEARAEAMRRFGNFDAARRQLHTAARQREAAMSQRERLGALVADCRYALRQARRAPGFTALAVASLALGIGATTAMFTLVDHVLLRSLPFPHAEQLAIVSGLDSAHNKSFSVSSADWLDWRKARTLQSSAVYGFPLKQALITGDSAVRTSTERVSSDFFAVLQPRFVVGRAFTARDVESGAHVAVVSERIWRQMLGADPRLTTPLRTAAASYVVLGVVAEGQEYPAGTDAWIPITLTPQYDPSRVDINWLMIARRDSTATVEQMRAELTTIARGIRASDPTALYDFGVDIESLTDSVVGGVSRHLEMLMAVVVLVLLIVCANVAASGLARATTRARELAIRTSLGAERGRLVQQLLIEHLLLGVLGGIAGLFIAWTTVRTVIALWGHEIPRASEVAVDARVFAFALVASLVAGVLAGIVPALGLSRVSLRAVLSAGGRSHARGGRRLAGGSLVALEIAMAMLLVTGAMLLVRSFRAVLGRDIGFDTNVATAEVTLRGPLYETDKARTYAYWDALVESFQSIPGVQAVGLAQWTPLALTGAGFIDVAGHDVPGATAVYRTVNAGYFAALRMPLFAGRTFDASDGATTARVAVINRTMAERYWPGESPLGKRVRARSMEQKDDGTLADWITVIGVVGDVRTYGLETDPRPEMYVYFRQTPSWVGAMTALVRSSGRASALLPELRRRARMVDPRVPIDAGTMDARLQRTLATRVLAMSLLGAFAVIALVLAALGIYGVLSYAVAQRTRELAVRAALGARRTQLVTLVFVAGFRVVALGIAIGLAAAFWVMGLLRAMLVDVAPIDPVSFGAAILALLVVALIAIVVPARRATRLDPMIALQAE
jgi:predicted permease